MSESTAKRSSSPRAYHRARRVLLCAAIPLAIWSAGCDVEVCDEEVQMRYDSAADQLDVLFIYKGLVPDKDDEDDIAKGVRAIEAQIAGARRFMVIDWPLYIDLDDIRKQMVEENDPADPKVKAVLELIDDVEIVDSGLFLDERERLSGYQHVRVKGASRIEALMNRSLSASILETAQDADSDDLSALDADTRALWVARAANEHRWFSLDEEGFGVHLPLTPKSRSLLVRKGLLDLEEFDEKDRFFLENLIGQLSSMQVDGTVTRFHFGHSLRTRGGRGFSFHRPDIDYYASLRTALAVKGIEPDLNVKLEDLRQRLTKE